MSDKKPDFIWSPEAIREQLRAALTGPPSQASMVHMAMQVYEQSQEVERLQVEIQRLRAGLTYLKQCVDHPSSEWVSGVVTDIEDGWDCSERLNRYKT